MDFVSPESVGVCFGLTEEFRTLPINHGCAEDKLEVCQSICIGLCMLVKCLMMWVLEMAREASRVEFLNSFLMDV